MVVAVASLAAALVLARVLVQVQVQVLAIRVAASSPVRRPAVCHPRFRLRTQ